MIFQKISISAFKNISTNRFSSHTNTCLFSSRKTVLLFGGQGNQEKGMLNKFLSNNKALSIIKEESDKLNVDLLEIATTDINSRLNVTSYTQPLLLLSQYLEIL
jgi:malonyl CoA-acyl carrier protein transacylase